MHCASCNSKECYTGKDCSGLNEWSRTAYSEEDRRSHTISTTLEAEHYMELNRLQELIEYSRLMGYRKLGIAFCIGLSEEARVLEHILSKDFEVHSVCCKTGGVDKTEMGLPRLHGQEGIEAMCNPLGQAEVLAREGTELNIILGLCIGHDILFTQASGAPVTTFAVKDRVLAHNPLGAIYSNYNRARQFGTHTRTEFTGKSALPEK